MFLFVLLPIVSAMNAKANATSPPFLAQFGPTAFARFPEVHRPFVRRQKPLPPFLHRSPFGSSAAPSGFPSWDASPKSAIFHPSTFASPFPFNLKRNIQSFPMSASLNPKGKSEKVKTDVEVVKSIEMEFDDVSSKLVPKFPAPFNKHKKRSDFSTSFGDLLSPKTNKNLKNIYERFQHEQSNNRGMSLTTGKNFQTGRFKAKKEFHANNSTNTTLPNPPCDGKPLVPKPRSNPVNFDEELKKDMERLMYFSVKKSDSQEDSSNRADLKKDLEYFPNREKLNQQPSGKGEEAPRFFESNPEEESDPFSDSGPNVIEIPEDDPNFSLFWSGNWTQFPVIISSSP